jgi:hypothetical protein
VRERLAVIEMDVKGLDTWERNILRSIHGAVKEQGIWGIRTNQE